MSALFDARYSHTGRPSVAPEKLLRALRLQVLYSAFVQLPMLPAAGSGDIRIEVRRGNTAIKVDWPILAFGDCAAWLRDWLR